MRISDWSSDVCSSDLSPVAVNRASGVTRAIVAPGGSSNLFAGQGAVVDLADDMDMVTKPRALQFVAFGEDGASKAGGSRAATFLLFREQLLAARSYARSQEASRVGKGCCRTCKI